MIPSWPSRGVLLTVGVLSAFFLTSCTGILPVTYDITPVWSPDGNSIAFVCYKPTPQDITSGRHDGELPYPPDSAEICAMHADGTGRQQLTHNHVADRDPIWSPDGTRIAYVSHDSLFLMNADGSDPEAISDIIPAVHPVWSPDGQSIAFAVDSIGINVVDLNAGHERQLSPGRFDLPTWSPDGKHIAFVEQNDGFACKTLVVQATTGAEVISPIESDCRIPAWSPSGTHLAFIARPISSRSSMVSILDLRDLTVADVVTNEHGIGDNLIWLPDSDRILYSAGGELIVVEVAGSEKEQISDLNGSLITFFNKRSMAISPDGQQIAFSQLESESTFVGPVRIWKIAVDGTGLIQLSP